MYDPSLGKWWQIDPIEKYHESGYAWVTNNPIRWNDPLGLDTVRYNDPEVDFDEDVVELPGIVITPEENYPEGNRSRSTNNQTGYIYDKEDLDMRKILLSLGDNVITTGLLRSEKEGRFEPLTADNYLRRIDERAGRMMMFGHTMFPATGSNGRLPVNRTFSYNRMYTHGQSRALMRGVSPSDIMDARTNPLKVTEVKYDAMGRPSQQYIGRSATVAVNPRTGKVITTWRTKTKLVNKLLRTQ